MNLKADFWHLRGGVLGHSSLTSRVHLGALTHIKNMQWRTANYAYMHPRHDEGLWKQESSRWRFTGQLVPSALG